MYYLLVLQQQKMVLLQFKKMIKFCLISYLISCIILAEHILVNNKHSTEENMQEGLVECIR